MSLKPVILIALVCIIIGTAPAYSQSTLQRTANPHGPMIMACTECHTSTSWKPIRALPEFNHNNTSFKLRGKHVNVACSSCHVDPVFKTAATACASCHADIHRRQFGTACESCHAEQGWNLGLQQARQHENRFPLTGAHGALECAACHKGAATGTFNGLSTACASCHLKDYNAAKAVNHVAARLSTNCEMCHAMSRWQGARFDHNTATKFPLTGAHTSVQCVSCHVNGSFTAIAQECVSCHLKDYNATTMPSHASSGYSQNCTGCHTTAQWQGAGFDHSRTRFPLTGAHSTVACVSCHVGGAFTALNTACASCHMSKFTATTAPNHVTAGFPTDCTTCHSNVAWTPATFNHSTTKFPLMGAHVSVACSTCHVNGKFAGLGTACVGCHLPEYTATVSPNHTAAGFPTDCTLCHTSVQWKGAAFDHNKTKFMLTGTHTTTACASCHVGNLYAGTPTDCYSCHSSEYNSVTSPNHMAAGFPRTCASCHTTIQWTGATFAHNQFPIYTGKHAGKWSVCADCHTDSSNYTVFSCTNCHTHSKATTDSHHSGIRGYVYDSLNCYSCHPKGTS